MNTRYSGRYNQNVTTNTAMCFSWRNEKYIYVCEDRYSGNLLTITEKLVIQYAMIVNHRAFEFLELLRGGNLNNLVLFAEIEHFQISARRLRHRLRRQKGLKLPIERLRRNSVSRAPNRCSRRAT